MKKNILLIILVAFFVGCETGIPYEQNTTKQKAPNHRPLNDSIERDSINILLDDNEVIGDSLYEDEDRVLTDVREEESEIEKDINSYSSGVITDGLDVRKIREGKHKGYIRLVFDVYDDTKAAKTVGRYDAKHSNSKKDISVILHGYRKFSALLPSFPHYSIIEQIHFDQYPENSGFKFHIKLRENATVKIFDLKNPARIVFDIKAI
jgi:hypothetical protein